MRSKLVTASLALLASCGAVFGMPQQAPPAVKAAPIDSAKKADPMAQALGHVRLLADRIEELRDATGKIQALVSLGDTSCKHDKGFAELLFTRANEHWKVVAREEEEKNKALPERPRFTIAISLRSQLLIAVTRCSPELALRLQQAEPGKEFTGRNDSSSGLNAAFRLLDEKKDEAVQFASRAIEEQPSDQTFQTFSMFLLRLRRQDAPAADQLFLTVLGRLRAQPKPDSYQLMALGNYLFSSMDLTTRPEMADGIGFVSVGGVSAISLQFIRPGVPLPMVRSYLESSLDMLSRPPADLRAQQLDYIAAYQFLRKARDSAPDLAPGFELVMRRLEQTLPDKMKLGSPNSELSRLAQPFYPSDEETESELGKTTDPEKRQLLLYRLAVSAWDKSDFARARKYASDLEIKEFRAQFLSAIDYMEAAKAVEEGRFDAALALGKNLPAGVERALLQTVLAAAQIAKGDSKAAFSLLDAAQRDSENVSLSVRPTLLVAITSVLARIDRDAALELLTRVVAAFNARDISEKPGESVQVFTGRTTVRGGSQSSAPDADAQLGANSSGFFKTLFLGRGVRSLQLKSKGIEAYDLNAKLLRLFSADAERVDAILSQLREEARLGPALAALAAAYLDAAESKPAKSPEKQ
jgi:hypothetical protein